MRHPLLVPLLLALSALPRPSRAEAPPTLAGADHLAVPGAEYKLAWHDEFDGEKLDETRWTSGLPWKGDEDGHWHTDGYASYITPEDISLADGKLHLTCRKKDIPGKTRKFHYTEGFITTHGKYNFQFGYAEISAKAPMEAGPGMWPAFWTLSKGWPPEFDVIELWTAEPRIHQGYCFSTPQGNRDWISYHARTGPRGWHRYAMEWAPGYVAFSIDGKVNKRIYGPMVTDLPQYLILNSAVCSGKGNIGPSDKSIFPNSFDVDYCRVYQRDPTPIVHNPGFESARLEPWEKWNDATLVKTPAHTGAQALRIATAPASAEQTLYGLKPKTPYELTGWIRLDKSGEEARLGIKNFGGDEQFAPATADRYSRVSLKFTTGPKNTTAILYCHKSSGRSAAFFDDITLTPLKR